MILLSIYADNVYMFRKFYLDFTISRKSSHFLSQDDSLFDGSAINVRKKLLILGGNASGKTTLGRLLCAVQNYLIGRELGTYVNLIEKRFDQNMPGLIRIEFAIDNVAFLLECEFDSIGILRESLRTCLIYPTYSINKLRDKLKSVEPVDVYQNNELKTGELSVVSRTLFISNLLFRAANKEYLDTFRKNVQFSYNFSNFASDQVSQNLRVKVDKLNNIMSNIDNSVDRIVALKPDDDKIISNSYMIVFKNGEQLTIPDGDLRRADRTRLSHGIYEALQFLDFMSKLKNNPNMTAFADEQLSHLHTELEAYLIMKAFLVPRKGQIFYTTHNAELLDLNISPQMVLLFHRNEEGFNESLYISDKIKKNDRSFKGYYDNDFFGVLPDYSILDEFFEEE